MSDDLNARLAVVEARLGRQRRLTAAAYALLVVLLALCVVNYVAAQRQPTTLTLSELNIVDSGGVARVRIGGALPDAVIDGKPTPRGEKAAGVLLYDDTGQERGGYVTWEPSGNVGLTLDSRHGQSALFVADPEIGTALQIWHANDLIELRSDDDGSRLTAVKDGAVVFQQPSVTELDADACAAYREALANYSYDEVMTACKKRFPAEACANCLDSTTQGGSQ